MSVPGEPVKAQRHVPVIVLHHDEPEASIRADTFVRYWHSQANDEGEVRPKIRRRDRQDQSPACHAVKTIAAAARQ